jgi:N-hydroxyarylamine O-acetyltransferase
LFRTDFRSFSTVVPAAAPAASASVMTSAYGGAMTSPVWPVDDLDLSAYLARIGYDGPLAPDLATLTALSRAHLAAIPFENLDILLGRGISAALPDVQNKLVTQRRGGYCYEHNTLFGAVLQTIGFSVVRLLARTGDPLDSVRPRSHMVLIVNGDHLADVGFGNGLLAPLPLAVDGPHQQGAFSYELVIGPDGAWRLRDISAGAVIQTFTEEPQYPVDIEVANFYTANSPRSPFTRRLIVMHKGATEMRSLIGRVFSIERPGEPTSRRPITDDELGEILRNEFSLSLSDLELKTLLQYASDPS